VDDESVLLVGGYEVLSVVDDVVTAKRNGDRCVDVSDIDVVSKIIDAQKIVDRAGEWLLWESLV